MAEFYPKTLKCDFFSMMVYIIAFFQCIDLIHSSVNDPKYMGTVTDRLQRTKDSEREEYEHQHDRQFHIPYQT